MSHPIHDLTRRIAATRPAVWLLSRVAYRLDHLAMRVSGGCWSATSILTGLDIVMLTTIGAKSGQPRTMPLLAIREGERFVLIASSFGRSKHPGWYFNLRAHPEATLSWKGQASEHLASEVVGVEREQYWQKAVEQYAGYAAYARRTGGRQIPIMVLEPRKVVALRD